VSVDRDRSATLTDQAVELLESFILDQALPPGALLPSQGALAEQLGVSRLVIREATRTLEARGLLETAQGRRLAVAAPSPAALSHLLDLAIRRDGDALFDLIDVRLAIEVHAARLAAERATVADLDAMEAAILAMEELQSDDPHALVQVDLDFHFGLVRAAGNDLLRVLVEALADPLWASRVQSFKGLRKRGLDIDVVVAAHRGILDALRTGDPEGAARAMEEHLRETLEDLRAAIGFRSAHRR
jgi:GntR family transcriptional regulator, transcriptional repressor for pyruvate dehydrogenase complex